MRSDVIYTVLVMADGVPIGHVILLRESGHMVFEASVGGVAAYEQDVLDVLERAAFAVESHTMIQAGYDRDAVSMEEVIAALRVRRGKEDPPPPPTSDIGDIPF